MGLQLAIVLTVGLWILLRRLRHSTQVTELDEPSEGDRRTVVLPEEDAAQMFETLTALQEELERYRKPGHAATVERAPDPVMEVPASEPVEESEIWDEEITANAITEKTVLDEPMERPESKPVEQVSPADRVLRNWLEDVEQLARRARRDSL